METPSDGRGNPEETPDPRLNKAKNSSQPEDSSESIHSSSEETSDVPRLTQDNQSQASGTSMPVSLDTSNTRTRSFGTHLSTAESQTSGYTTDSIFQTPFAFERPTHIGSMGSIQTEYGPPPMNFLREVHMGMDPASSVEEVQSIRRDLQELLTNAMFHIRQRNNQAIYIIAYNYM